MGVNLPIARSSRDFAEKRLQPWKEAIVDPPALKFFAQKC